MTKDKVVAELEEKPKLCLVARFLMLADYGGDCSV
jgi:hypothetical protein